MREKQCGSTPRHSVLTSMKNVKNRNDLRWMIGRQEDDTGIGSEEAVLVALNYVERA